MSAGRIVDDPGSVGAGVVEVALVPQVVAGLRVFGSRIVGRDDVIAADADAGNRRRLHRKRLRGGVPFAGRVAFWNRAFFDREDRLACDTVEDEDVADFTGLNQLRYGFAAVLHIH